MYDLTGSTLAVGALGICEFVPILAVALVSGALADAFDRRLLVVFSELGSAVLMAALLGNALLDEPQAWVLFVCAAVLAGFYALLRPPLDSLVPRVVPREQLKAAMALEWVRGNVGMIAGPSPPPADADAPSLRSIAEGLRYAGSRPELLGTYLVDMNAMLFGMPQALFPAIAAHHFDAGARVVGLLYAAPSAGALLAALTSGWIGHVRRQGVAVSLAIVVWGIAIAIFGFSTTLWPALAMLAIAGCADEISAILRSTILFASTPDHFRGRMQGFELTQVASTPALGNVEAGIVASLTSLRFSVVSGGIACAAGALAILALLPDLFRYDSSSREQVSDTTARG
jgi:MFS family permease